MNIKKGVVAGFLGGIAMVIADVVVYGATQGYLLPLYQASVAVWKPMEPLSAWLAWYLSLLVAEGILFGLVYSVLYNGIPGTNINKGINYGMILWLVGIVPGMAVTYLMMTVPTPIVASWLFGGLLDVLVMGAVLAYVYERMK